MSVNEYVTAEHAEAYLAVADTIPRRSEGESVLLDLVPADAKRILDLGTGDGRLLSLLLRAHPDAEGVALDFSPTMLEAATERFRANPRVRIVRHDLDEPLPDLGSFDVVVSAFAIHHCEDARKKSLYREIHERLEPGGVFCNLEHVASPTASLHRRFLESCGATPEDEDPSNKLASVEDQLAWLRREGLVDVDCFWKWLELALIGGWKATDVQERGA